MDINHKNFGLSLEIFPPRNLKASFKLWRTIEVLEKLNPNFISVTYGAGGSTRELTQSAVSVIAKEYNIDVAGHLTCVGSTKKEIMDIALKYGELSGGQRQRVALARAIVAGQRLCLMDEPLSNLDAKLRSSVRKDIKKLQRDLGITVVYVTHDQTEAMSMADKVVLMKDGRIQQIGSPNELYSYPENTFVAEFIGAPAMALMDSYLIDGIKNGNKIGIRAENITIVPEGKGRLSCSVTEAEFLGSETLIGLEHEGTIGLNVLQPGLSIVPSGQRIDITFDDQDLHIFNSAGDRINGQ
ncbi:methylenetetrahydrofolate reductase [Amylibacter sp.]|nr:methylenetetrahydrofolate reductase [Amylibacter sp.]